MSVHFSLIILICTALPACSSSAFTWRGNVLRLKERFISGGPVAPFKMESPKVTIDFSNEENSSEQYPLLPEAKPQYPGHRQLVFSNEMKFRELMSDSQKMYSDMFIRCYVDESGGIERVGLLCRIIERKFMKNGQGAYIIESKEKIIVDDMAIKEGKSYLSSTKVQPVKDDYLTVDEVDLNEKLSTSIFNEHKFFLRLTRIMTAYAMRTGNPASGFDLDAFHAASVSLTPRMIKYRPGQDDFGSNTPTENTERHNNYSYTMGNILDLFPPKELHALLICSTFLRLTALDALIKKLVNELRDQVVSAAESTDNLEIVEVIQELEKRKNDIAFDDLIPSALLTEMCLEDFKFDDEEAFEASPIDADDEIMQ